MPTLNPDFTDFTSKVALPADRRVFSARLKAIVPALGLLFLMSTQQAKFEALVGAHYRELYSFAHGLCRHAETAEDLVQETFARAWKSLSHLKEEKAARAWLYTILRREHARLYERKRPEVRPPEDLPDVATVGHDASTEAFNLHRAMSELSEEYREPLLLQVIGGFSCADIGKMLDISENAVMTRVYRARRALRDKLAPDGEKPELIAKGVGR